MIARIRHWWQEMRSSFWFLPALIVLGAVALAVGLIVVDVSVELHVDKRWPLIFGSGASGARGLLTAVASSMITVAGVVFSITIVALALTSSQYTSRVLGNFMRDRMNQTVLGVFVGVFAYCLVVLRTIRGGDEGAFVPSLAVLGGLVLAFVGIGYLIVFIHHISLSIQASSIIAAAAEETIAAVDRLFPRGLGEDGAEDAGGTSAPAGGVWSIVAARKTGYIQSVDGDALLAWAKEHETVLRMERGIGEFVVEGAPLVSVAAPGKADEQAAAELGAVYFISRKRTVQQDAGFGVRQIVDVALKALSPGINDTTTAVTCVQYLTAVLARVAERRLADRHRMDGDTLRVIARGPTFPGLLGEAFDQIRRNADGNVAVLLALLEALEVVAGRTRDAGRRLALARQVGLTAAVARRSVPSLPDRAGIEAALERHTSRGVMWTTN